MAKKKPAPSSSPLKSDERASLLELAKTAKTLEELEAIERRLNPSLKPGGRRPPEDAYERKKRREATRQREQSRRHRDIAGSCPDCISAEIRDRILADLKYALEMLFPERFHLAWGPDQLTFLKHLQGAIETGDQLAVAMPRGTGKTSILLGAVIWAILKGKHLFVALLAATSLAARELLEQITTLLETNDQLYAYFPELIHPIRCLEGIRQRRLLWNGEPVRQQWTKDRIILPDVPGAHGAGAIIKTAGLLGRIRGMNYQRPDGTNVRPTLCLVDDPQTDQSARSQKQTHSREKTLCETVPGLAGPGKRIAVLVACTVIQPDDLSDRILSRDKHPEFHGIRTKLLPQEPADLDLWNQYAEILRECLRNDEGIGRATRFYKKNRKKMNKGAVASWPARFNDDEISAVQFAMNLKLLHPEMFAAEYQNCPLVVEEADAQTDPDAVVKRLSGHKRGALPLVEYLTGGIDVQKNYLVWTIAGFEQNATPYVIDYGTWPDQKLQYFDRRSATRTIERAFPKADEDTQLWKAIEALTAELFAREFVRVDDGSRMSLKRICIDVRYRGQVIKRYVRQSPHRDALLPAQGIAIKPGAPGINDREAKPGEISKHDFRLPPLGAGQIARTASFDSAEYISKVHDALNTPLGSPGAMTLFDAPTHVHRCFADQLCSEYSTWIEAKGRKKRAWNPRPNGGDNDFLDATKLAFLAAYTLGMEPGYAGGMKKPKRLTAAEIRDRRARSRAA